MKTRDTRTIYKSCYLKVSGKEVVTKPSFGGICHRNYLKVGCYKRDWERVSDLVITDLDPTHKNYSKGMDWGNYETGLHSLACRCREKTEGHYKYFAIGFHGEYIASKNTIGLEEMFAKEKESGQGCINGEYANCDKDNEKECTGAADYDFFYQVI